MLRTTTLRLLVVLVAALGLGAAPASALTPRQIFGIGDQNDGAEMFDDPLLTALKPKATRYIANLSDATTPGRDRDRLDAWYKAASAKGLRMLISLQKLNSKVAPSGDQYLRAFKAFRARYPLVKEYSAFNEANHNTQPTYRKPKLAAKYAHLAKVACPTCRIVSLTLVLGYENDIRYAQEFMKALPPQDRAKVLFGLSTYSDTNRRSSKRIKKFMTAFPKGEVWFTEAAAWAQFAPPTWPFDLQRQARTTQDVFRQAIVYRKRVTRVYWYEWRGAGLPAERWDSGLLNPDGTPRPAYKVALAQRFKTS